MAASVPLGENDHKVFEQFSEDVTDFSSQYGSETSISYTVSNISGKPSVYPKYGDFTQAAVFRTYGPWWHQCPSAPKPIGRKTSDSFCSQDFIELSFPIAVYPVCLNLYETYNPGAIVRVLAYICENERWVVLWQGTPDCDVESRIYPMPLKKIKYVTNLLRLEFNSTPLAYYTELDAAVLFGVRLSVNQNCSLPGKSSSVDPSHFNQSTANSETDHSSGPPSESIVEGLSRLHLRDGLSAALEESDNGYFDMLPVEVLQVILGYLDLRSLCDLAVTSHYMRSQCYDCHQYIELDLQPYWHQVTDESLGCLAKRCHRLQRLSMSWCGGRESVTPQCFTSFLQPCGAELQCLRLACCKFVCNSTFRMICDTCPNIVELDLQCNFNVVGVHYAASLPQLVHLRRLNLYRTLIENAALVSVIRSCVKLEHLNIGSCSRINDHNEICEELGKHCKNLRSIDMWRARGLHNGGIFALSENCSKLEEVDIGWCSQVVSASGCIVKLAKRCPNLKKLFLTANRSVCNMDLQALGENCTFLEQLDILGTKEVSVSAVGFVLAHCPRLRFLDVSFCAGLDHATVMHLQQRFPSVKIKKSFQNV